MKKLIIGLLAGMVLTCALFIGPLSQETAHGSPGEYEEPEIPAGTDIDREILLSTLREAGDGIQDEEIAAYYHKLLEEYDLDGISTGDTPADPVNLSELPPDIYDINRKAASLPLIEAGKNIQDEEIARFYNQFLKDTGWISE
jgi:hypothetical protein